MEPSSIHPQEQRQTLVERYFTGPPTSPITHDWDDGITWTRRAARAGDFVQEDVEAPDFWSDTAVGVTAKLYFATVGGERESSVRAMIERVAGRITTEGVRHGYFGGHVDPCDDGHDLKTPDFECGVFGQDARVFFNELCYLLVHQMASFNTPVWLNVGVPGRAQCCSACFLLKVEDSMFKGEHSITRWWDTEARIFKMGAGSGINVSSLRGSMEPLSTGGYASGPLAYVRASDAAAGTLKSGGAHRRAAKMIIEDVGHPDIRDFINSKPREDRRMRILAEAGEEINPFTPSGEQTIAETTSFQNENQSVAVTEEFMRRATEFESSSPFWRLKARTTDDVVEEIYAPDLLSEIAAAAWICGDPGMVYIDTVNQWHTTPSLGPITTCNPCGETWLNDDSSCNLASLNLLKFLGDDCRLRVEDFRHAVDVMILAMDITCSFSDLPTPEIERNTRELRQLGLGYANLGAALMVQGLPYDSDEGRDWAASVTALMTGRAYRRSAELARAMGSYARFEENRDAHLGVMQQHDTAMFDLIERAEKETWLSELIDTARESWAEAITLGHQHGYRNSQVTVIAPTGTTSLMMGCDTSGCEPAFALVVHKGLAGGGSIVLENQSVGRALAHLGVSMADTAELLEILRERGVGNFLLGLPSGVPERVFDCANDISAEGHVKMVAALQPFLSGAPSKTVNLPESASIEDIERLYVLAWRLGCKAISVYRDGSKATQVLSHKKKEPATEAATGSSAHERGERAQADFTAPIRNRLPRERQAITHKFSLGGHEGYITAGLFEDGRLGEIFVTGAGKEGSFVNGMMGWGSILTSMALQYGVPLDVLVEKFTGMSFEPSGATGNPEIPTATSLPDYLMRWLASRFLDIDEQEAAGVLTPEVKARMTARLDAAEAHEEPTYFERMEEAHSNGHARGPRATKPCSCGGLMVVTGTCFTCQSCGVTTGCA